MLRQNVVRGDNNMAIETTITTKEECEKERKTTGENSLKEREGTGKEREP
jgi:hypothetical protein